MCLGCHLLEQMPEEMTGADFLEVVSILCAGMLATMPIEKRAIFFPELIIQVERLIAFHTTKH